MKSRFVQYLLQKYPLLKNADLDHLISDQLLSPFTIPISPKGLGLIKKNIAEFEDLKKLSEIKLNTDYSKYQLRKSFPTALCTSYDFHMSPNQEPELIEINTNAAFLAMGLELYDFLGKPTLTGFQQKSLVEMFLSELQHHGALHKKIYILDEKPTEQRLYIEFLIYKNILESNGIECEIIDLSEIESLPEGSLVYNRYTDFYLTEEKSKKLKELYNSKKILLSPHPYEYFLVADKQRLFDWNQWVEAKKPESLLPVYDLGPNDKEKIWIERKSLFFKPKNSFGSKQVYKGASISKGRFDDFFTGEFIAQKYSEPAQITVTYQNEPLTMKYDLRCYVYKGQLQLIIGRLYQGQTTNLKTLGGGFAIVEQIAE